MIFRTRRARLAGLLSLPALAFSSPLLAGSDLVVSYAGEPGTVTRAIAVDVSDLNTSTRAGRIALDARLVSAARKVCGYSVMHGLNPPKDYERCFTQTMADARAKTADVRTASLQSGALLR